jgi:tRNA(fMet)-specific endonuclease VapC
MIGYLFDTCMVRNWYARNSVVTERVDALDPKSLLYVSSITLGEIEYGHTSPHATDKRKQAHFRRWITDTFEVPELHITAATALEYAKFRRRLFTRFTRCGKFTENCEDRLGAKIGIDENDLWLVAQACERKLKFITNDNMERIREIVDSDVEIEVWPES